MSGPQRASWLTLDALVDYPRPGTNGPTQFGFSPDGRFLTFLWSERGDLIRDLWALEVATQERRVLVRAEDLGEPEGELTQEETLRRERQRVRDSGITQYHWAKNADRLLIPFNGQLYVTDSRGQARSAAPSEAVAVPARLTPVRHGALVDEAAVDARLIPDGQRVVFARAKELWVADLETGEATQLTFDSSEMVSNGVAEFIAQEEMGRANGFWISPDATSVAYAQVDEGHIPVYPIVHQAGAWRVEHHRYPFAGAANAHVRLGVVPLGGGATHWLDLGSEEDVYLARVDWQSDDRLLVQIETRDQKRLELRAYQVPSGEFKVLLVEESDVWINLHNDLRVLEDQSFVWAAERSGFKHLSLHGPEGEQLRALTAGQWPVDGVVHVDDVRRRVYFTGGRESPLERHLFWASLDGGEIIQLTNRPGFHSAVFAADGDHYVETAENLREAPSSVLRGVESGREVVVHRGGSLEDLAPGLEPPELVELEAADGTRLFGSIYRPPGVALARPGSAAQSGGRPLPVEEARRSTIVVVYGGPHAQMVTNTWGMSLDLRAQYLASLGFVVFKLDNRGSGRRGLAFESALSHRLGTVEVEDQVAGVRWLAERGIADPNRVGVYGWSYGGYMSALCLLKAGETFKAAVAGAPVADWDGYDTHYTERYMGTPDDNPDGYHEASLLTHAEKLRGKLLIVHGMLDENVHFRHTARFILALEQAERPFDLLLLPDERHGLRPNPRNRSVRRHLEERMARFFQEHL